MNWDNCDEQKKRHVINKEYIEQIRLHRNTPNIELCLECNKRFNYPVEQILTGIPLYDLSLRSICAACMRFDFKNTDYKKKWPYADVDMPDWYTQKNTHKSKPRGRKLYCYGWYFAVLIFLCCLFVIKNCYNK